MKRILLNVGTRPEIIAELNRYGSDRLQGGKEDRARDFARAVRDLEDGDSEVYVEHAIYRVLADGESLSDWDNPTDERPAAGTTAG